MGTRGFVGFAVGGELKIAYNHWDSYPSGLGLDVLSWLRGELAAEESGIVSAWRTQAKALTAVPDRAPTDEERTRLAKFRDDRVGGPIHDPREEWYKLLRETQGKPGAILEAGYFEDAKDFPLDSLFCEYGYLVDLDGEHLEVYEGFQRAPVTSGRWAGRQGDDPEYYPVRLRMRIAFDALPADREFVDLLEPVD